MSDQRPLLASITGHLAPYREHLIRRIAGEVHEVRVATLLTKRRSHPWVNPDVPEIGTVMLDPGPDVPRSGLKKLRHELIVAKRLVEWLNANRPRAVMMTGYDEIPVLRALRWCAKTRTPAFITADSNIRGDRATGVRRLIKNIYVPRVTANAAGVFVFGEMGRQFFRRYGVTDDRLFTVPCEPEYALIESTPVADALSFVASLGLDPARKRIICCCRLVDVKRVDLVIDAFTKIAGEHPDWDLIICGDGPLRADLERRARIALPDAKRIVFTGFLDQRKVTALYLASRVLVLASDYEPWALVINEAACAGLAIVASDCVGAAVELVRENVNGHVVPSGDAAALERALRSVMTGARAVEMGRESRRVFGEWRIASDPVRGVRGALKHTGVI
jgi:glycosyltransferase involved in cell wall biosynthesis